MLRTIGISWSCNRLEGGWGAARGNAAVSPEASARAPNSVPVSEDKAGGQVQGPESAYEFLPRWRMCRQEFESGRVKGKNHIFERLRLSAVCIEVKKDSIIYIPLPSGKEWGSFSPKKDRNSQRAEREQSLALCGWWVTVTVAQSKLRDNVCN